MANIIAVVNQKGGVGKTTTTVNITAALRALGKRVLLCDFDAQANATSGMGVDKNTASPNVYDVLINGAEPQKAVVSTKYGDVLPSNKALAGASIEMIAIPDREHLLQKALEQLAPNYDYIFIDCPPSLEMLTVNALCAAGSLLVPVQCEYYALEGLSDLLATVVCHGRRRGDGVDTRHYGKGVADIRSRVVTVHGLEFSYHKLLPPVGGYRLQNGSHRFLAFGLSLLKRHSP